MTTFSSKKLELISQDQESEKKTRLTLNDISKEATVEDELAVLNALSKVVVDPVIAKHEITTLVLN